jgi:hypothetical protein
MLSAERHHDSWVFRPLALVDCCCKGERQLIELTKAVGDFAAIELGVELTCLDVDARHDTKIAVVDVLDVIVFEPIACCY